MENAKKKPPRNTIFYDCKFENFLLMEKELKEIASCKKDLFVRAMGFLVALKNKLFYYN